MAGKATRLPDPTKFAAGKPTTEDAANLAKLAESAKVDNEKKAAAEARRSNVPDETYKNNWDAITDKENAVKVLEKDLKSARGKLESAYSVAQNDGCNIKAMKRLRKMQKEDIDELDAEMRVIARIAGIVESPVAETNFMMMLTQADEANPFTMGFAAGKRGDAADTNPNKPGTEKFEKWRKGWGEGQLRLAQDKLGVKPKKAPKAKKVAAPADAPAPAAEPPATPPADA